MRADSSAATRSFIVGAGAFDWLNSDQRLEFLLLSAVPRHPFALSLS
jgi:hypothetical protein